MSTAAKATGAPAPVSFALEAALNTRLRLASLALRRPSYRPETRALVGRLCQRWQTRFEAAAGKERAAEAQAAASASAAATAADDDDGVTGERSPRGFAGEAADSWDWEWTGDGEDGEGERAEMQYDKDVVKQLSSNSVVVDVTNVKLVDKKLSQTNAMGNAVWERIKLRDVEQAQVVRVSKLLPIVDHDAADAARAAAAIPAPAVIANPHVFASSSDED